MPYIIRDFLNDTTGVSAAELSSTTERPLPVIFSKAGQQTQNACYAAWLTNRFYLDLKMMLQQTTLNISFDDSKYSFNVFGINFYIIVDSYYGAIPTVYKDYDYDWQTPFTGYFKNTASPNRRDSIYSNKSDFRILVGTTFNYRINIHYNDNYLHITFGPTINMNLVLPLCCIIKGMTIENKEVVYLSGECNTSSMGALTGTSLYNIFYVILGTSSSLNGTTSCAVGHNLFYIDNLSMPLTNSYSNFDVGYYQTLYNINPFAIFSNLKSLNQGFLNKVLKEESNKNKYIKTKPIVLGGLVNLDNCLEAPDDMPGGLYYEIDNEIYFLPKTQYEVDWNSSASSTSTYTATRHRLLLKI